MSLVFLVIDTELGWDNVVDVFLNEEDAEDCVADRGGDSFIITKTLNESFMP